MAKSVKKAAPSAAAIKQGKPGSAKKTATKKLKVVAVKKKQGNGLLPASMITPAPALEASGVEVLDRLFDVISSRKEADPSVSHSARLLSRGTAKVAQKFGEEAVECLIEAVAGNAKALVSESADVLYHLLVLWVDAGVQPDEVWAELLRREGVSGIAEKAARPQKLAMAFGLRTTKIP
jgi:phosphoribosyl-ATP pyrophosphohydrolase